MCTLGSQVLSLPCFVQDTAKISIYKSKFLTIKNIYDIPKLLSKTIQVHCHKVDKRNVWIGVVDIAFYYHHTKSANSWISK